MEVFDIIKKVIVNRGLRTELRHSNIQLDLVSRTEAMTSKMRKRTSHVLKA
jgi:hypothetical protein